MKTIIVKAPKPRKFDLSFSKPGENLKVLSALESLKQNQGWYFLIQMLEKEKAMIDNGIITKIDTETGKIMSDADVDLLRIKRNYLDELIKMPDKVTGQLAREEQEPYDADPYDKEVRPAH